MILQKFNSIPNDWVVLPFLDVFKDASAGKIKIKSENYQKNGAIPVVDQGQFLIGGYTDEVNSIVPEMLPVIIFGDHTRVFKFINFPFALGADGVKLLIPKIEADKKYLFYYLNNLRIESAGYSRHFKFLKEQYILLPPLPVQKQIAKILEQADTLRQQCQLMEQELNALAQSVFLDMFGDYRNQGGRTFRKLGEIADVCSGVTKGQNLAGKTTIVAPYMRVANVQDGYLDLSVIKEIEVKISDFEKYKLKSGDVLLTEGGDFDKLGRGAVWSDEIPNCIHQNHIFRVRFEQNINPKYFEFYLQSGVAREYFLRCAKKTTNLASINITQLKSLPVPIESKEKQDNFEHFISKIDKQINIIRSDLAEKNILFNAIIQKAFNGQLNIKAVA